MVSETEIQFIRSILHLQLFINRTHISNQPFFLSPSLFVIMCGAPIDSGTRTLNAVRSSQYQHDYHPNNNSNMWHRTSAGRSSNNSGGTSASSKERHQARSNNFLAAQSMDNGDPIDVTNEFDTVSNASSTDGVRALNYNPDMVLFKAQRDQQMDVNAQNSASSGDSSTSMLVAEHGFVRFRPMENLPKDKKETKPSNSDNNNKNSPAIMQRHHKRSLTNS